MNDESLKSMVTHLLNAASGVGNGQPSNGSVHIHGDVYHACVFYFVTPESPVADHNADAEKSGESGKT